MQAYTVLTKFICGKQLRRHLMLAPLNSFHLTIFDTLKALLTALSRSISLMLLRQTTIQPKLRSRLRL